MDNFNEEIHGVYDGEDSEVGDKWDLWDYVRDYLTDFNDNFVGEPCSEIIEEVLEQVDDCISIDEMIKEIHEICDNMFG